MQYLVSFNQWLKHVKLWFLQVIVAVLLKFDNLRAAPTDVPQVPYTVMAQ